MYHGHHKRDVTHTLTAYLLLGHLHTAAVADDTLVTDTLILAAMALVILHGAEDALTEETVALGLVGTVVDSLGLQHLAARLCQNLLRRGQTDRNAAVTVRLLVIFDCHNSKSLL